MFIHYLKTTFRNIWKYKTQSLIGIFGLAFAMACFVPTLYWMHYETSYDSFQTDSERIYRTYAVEKQSGKMNELVPGILAKKMSEQIPAVEAATIFIAESNNCKTETMPHVRLQTLITDSTFFQVFPQEFVSGDRQQPLQVVFNMVITESVALRLFGDVEKAIGQKIQSTYYFFNPPYVVTAVVKDSPDNTNLPFDALLSHDLMETIASAPEDLQWIQFNTQMYVKFYPHTNVSELVEELRDFTVRLGTNPNMEVRMIHVNDVRHRLNSDLPFTINFIRLFIIAGVLLLFSAVFNFLNLHLNLFHQRYRELHLRSVQGAKSWQLILQMLFELGCTVLLSLLLGGCFTIIACPSFSGLLNLSIKWPELIRLFALCGVGVWLLMVLIGFIIFWRLSHLAIQPISKSKTNGQSVLRRIAVTLQLAVSVVFIIAAWVVMLQIRFVNHKDMGFNRNGIIQINGLPPYMERNLRTSLITELTAIPQIQNITTSNFEPQHKAKTFEMINKVKWPGKLSDEGPTFNVITTDHKFARTFRLPMIKGDWWKEGGIQKVVINEAAARVMGLSDPVGTTIRFSLDDVDVQIENESTMKEYEITGVVKDFHTLSLRSHIHPTIFLSPHSRGRIVMENVLYLQVPIGQEQQVVERIIAILPNIDPTFSDLRLTTLTGLYDSFNHSEQVGLKMFSLLAIVCLLISLFGIYAVATASTQRRRKEIAIRKVAGANVSDIIRLFFHEYILQVIFACVISLPFAYLAMNRWLQGYAYHTNIPWWLFLVVIVGVVLIVLFTVFGQVRKAANSNPSEVVKNE